MSRFFRNKKFWLIAGLCLGFLYWIWLPGNLFNDPLSPVLLDENKELLAAQTAGDGQWRFKQEDQLPSKFEKCILTFEDEYFYCHPGINPISMGRALKNNFGNTKRVSGASTITMQLARIYFKNRNRTFFQKLKEIFFALRIEMSYRKKSILNLYAQTAPFGGNVVGISAASWRYFGKDVSNLSWAESALMAVLPNSPGLIYPGKNHSRLIEKRDRLLRKLFSKGVIDTMDYRLSVLETLPGKPFPLPQLAPHLLSRCIAENKEQSLFGSTVIKNVQERAALLLNQHIKTLAANHVYNACVLISETRTGKVIAYVGNSTSPGNEHENFVDIIKAPRSSGSILKPFLYAFMLNENKILPGSLLEDIPTRLGSYGPKNFSLEYDGLVPANQALSRSLNVPAVNSLRQYGAEKFHQRLKQLGFTTFVKPASHYGLSLILGGGEVTLWELAGAYASMGRALEGYTGKRNRYTQNNYRPLYFLKKDAPVVTSKKQYGDLIGASSVYFTFSAMTELLRPQDQTGWGHFLSKRKIAWKTGTSFGFRDAWAVGVDPEFTVAVWVGNADGEGRPELTGTSAAAPLLFSVFNILSKKNWFKKPVEDLETIIVCAHSGFKASAICDEVVQKEYPKGASKTSPCPFHQLVHLDETERFQVNSNCYPVEKMKHRPWFVASASQEYFFRQKSSFYRTLPPFLSDCGGDLNSHHLEILYPKAGFKIYVPVDHSGKKSSCVLKATHKDKNAILYWHLDNQYIGSTSKFHELAVTPPKGIHALQVTDNLGETSVCSFEVVDR